MDLRPVLPEDIDAVGQFLHEHLNKRITPQTWAGSMRHRWAAEQPNHGMQLFNDQGQRVGALLAVYSDQLINGKTERFCNPHSWCVLDDYRHASISLVLGVIKQRGYQFTMFTPNPKVAQVFTGLRFKLLDDGLFYFPNLPRPWPAGAGSFVEARQDRIASRLQGAALAEFEAHRQIPWLRFVAFGKPGEACLVIYKVGRWKKMACARLVHVSDAALFARHGHLLRAHLLGRGMPVARIESRFLDQAPPLAYRTRRLQPKLALTRNLADSQVRDVYSELMALDI
jgi:hypothetical protein